MLARYRDSRIANTYYTRIEYIHSDQINLLLEISMIFL